MKSVPAIGFRYRASLLLAVATASVALLAIVATWLIRGPAWLHLVLIVIVAAYAVTAIRNLARPSITSLLWRADGGVELTLRDGSTETGRTVQGALQGTRVLGPLIVLTLRWPPRGHATIWLLPDNLDADTRRRLRMRLGAEIDALASGNADSG